MTCGIPSGKQDMVQDAAMLFDHQPAFINKQGETDTDVMVVTIRNGSPVRSFAMI